MLEFLHHQHLAVFLLSVLRACAWLVILSTIFVPLEYFFTARPGKFFRKSLFGDLGFYFISGFIPHLLLIVPLSLAAYVAYQFVPWRVTRRSPLGRYGCVDWPRSWSVISDSTGAIVWCTKFRSCGASIRFTTARSRFIS